jgi:hypothetical protein
MAQEPIFAPAEPPPVIVAHAPSAEIPEPTADQERVADDVFARGAAALLALQAGAGVVGLLIDNNTSKPLPAEVPPRVPPERKE